MQYKMDLWLNSTEIIADDSVKGRSVQLWFFF